ncbi:MAG: ABC transporter ATP-binding protein [Bacillota bacterium]|nr:ABC transporter ATP-binding protein [Bacillota bacterium]
MGEKAMLRVENLQMHFYGKSGTVKAVDGISFSVDKGETFGLVGESGCGKTTAGKSIMRILKPTGGHVYYKENDLATLNNREIQKYNRELQMIFQDPYSSLDPRQKAYSILREAIVCDKKPHTKQEIDERVTELLRLVGLHEDMALRFPHELSGGQRQRLSIARALACNPQLIVCDEPVSALDVSVQAQIVNLFMDLQEQLGLTYIFIAHDLAVVRHIAKRIGIMYLGHLVEVLDADDLYDQSMHPYTRALLSAVPTTEYYEEQKRERIILKGEVPSPIHVPSGCPFHPRCMYATEECMEKCPTLAEAFPGHFVACFHKIENE